MDREEFTQWALEQVPAAFTAPMLAVVSLRTRGLHLTGLSATLVDTYNNMITIGASNGVTEGRAIAWLRTALEHRVLNGAG